MSRSRPVRGDANPAVTAALAALSSRDCAVIGLLLVERLSLVEAAIALGVSVPRLRRDYEAAVARVRRVLAPLVRKARRLGAAASPTAGWRRAS